MVPGTRSLQGRVLVADASAVLAILNAEPNASWCVEQLRGVDRILVSAVNHAEVQIKLGPTGRPMPNLAGYTVVPVDASLAESAAWARLRYARLNFGDCFAYALARREGVPLLATDRDFSTTDLEVLIPG